MSSPAVAIDRRGQGFPGAGSSDLAGPVRTVQLFGSFTEAARPWRALEAVVPCSPYGRLAWAAAWHATVGVDEDIEPCIAVGLDRDGRAIVLLPLGLRRVGMLTIAEFLGGKDSNGNLGLFAGSAVWTPVAVKATLKAVAVQAGIDLFALRNQPERWAGVDNPLLTLPHQPSPSFGRSGALLSEPEQTLKARLSNHARKQVRNKEGRLRAERPVEHRRAGTPAEIDSIVEAYLVQRAERAQATGAPAPTAALGAFLRRGADPSGDDTPALELHALRWGSELVAVLGGTVHQGRFSGMVLSFDGRPEVARSSPGELLVVAVLADLSRRGFTSFDLGIGEARYKATFCDTVEPLFDSFIGISPIGRAVALAMATSAQTKRRIKQSPRLWPALLRLRATLARGRFSQR